MSPILVRPVREQLEHDRVIRLLQAKYKRKFEVAINPGNEQTAPVGSGPSPWYPDLVLQEKGRKLVGIVEVETAESVNNLEAMSQWAAFGKLRAQFHLYVPASAIDSARRLCTDLGIPVAEIWAYHSIGDQLRFTLVQKVPGAMGKIPAEWRPPAAPRVATNGAPPAPSRPVAVEKPAAVKPKPEPAPAKAAAKPAVAAKVVAAVKPAPAAKPVPAVKPVLAAKKPVGKSKAAPAKTAPAKAAPAKVALKTAPAKAAASKKTVAKPVKKAAAKPGKRR